MSENGGANEVTPPVTNVENEVVEPETSTTTATSINDLKPKMELRGKVKRIELFGAFVDLGVGIDGLVHISQLKEEPVNNVKDVLSEGDEVTVYVRRVDTNQGRIDLTMIKPPGMLWNELQTGQVLTGTVVRVEKFGAFIDVGAERPGMVHVSELSSGYVGAPQDVVKVGDEVQVKVIKVNSRKKQIDLSIKALEMPAAPATKEVEEDDDKVPTAMELALRRALLNSGGDEFPALQRVIEGADSSRDARSKKHGKRDKQRAMDKRRQQQEEILSRTLTNRARDRNPSPANN